MRRLFEGGAYSSNYCNWQLKSLLHLGQIVITFRTLLHLRPFITFRPSTTFTPIAKNFMLYCRLIYTLSILCVRLTIKVKVGIPESFKVGWYPPPKKKKLGRVTLTNSFYWNHLFKKLLNILFDRENKPNSSIYNIVLLWCVECSSYWIFGIGWLIQLWCKHIFYFTIIKCLRRQIFFLSLRCSRAQQLVWSMKST